MARFFGARKPSDEGTEYSHDEPGTSKPQGPWQRYKAHFSWKRFLLITFIIVTVCVLCITLPIVYVAYPKIAQGIVSRASDVIFTQSYTNPAPNSLNLYLQAALLHDHGYGPHLYPWNASLYLEGRNKPFTAITIPEIKHARNFTRFTVHQTLQLQDEEEILAYTKALIVQKTVNLRVVGRGDLKEGGLPRIGVNFNLSTSFSGFNALPGLKVSNLRLATAGESLPYNSNAHGNVTVPNPSSVTVALGDVTLNMSVAGTHIGYTTLPAFSIKPGNATYPLYATVDEFAVANVLAMPKYRCGTIDVSLIGTNNASVYEGTVVPYTTQALMDLPLAVRLDLTDTLKAANLSNLITGECQT